MIRLFVGLDLPEDLRDRLAAVGVGLPGMHWVPEDNLHLTLRFIGEVDEDVANDLHDALSGIHAAPFPLTITGTGIFETGHRPHTFYASVEKTDALSRLQNKIESVLVRAGQEPEGRKFTPHITLAKLRDTPASRLHDFLSSSALLHDEWTVEYFTLFSSQLGAGDPVYTAEADYPLSP
ncbi:MAG TPA: RNA 2',3'-cyclic phosphodiesterase [Magnetospirillaceae bacterium]|jgi:2'-5' RNA ligase